MVNTAAAGVVAKVAGANATTYNTVADEYSATCRDFLI
jgi:hypothetical protein